MYEEMNYLDRLIEFLKVLSDPTRMKIIKFLLEKDLCVCELVEIMDVAQPTVSQHLRRLKSIGLTEERREGQRMNYRLVKPVLQRHFSDLEVFMATPIGEISDLLPEYERYLNNVAGGKIDCTSEKC